MKILIRTLSDSIGFQIVDAWHAYVQHVNKYHNDAEYVFLGTDDDSIVECDVSILLDYMGDRVTDAMVSRYDIVLITNACESLCVGSPRIKQLLAHDNVYFISNSYLMDHEIKSKIIWFAPNITMCRDYWTRHFYPQFYDTSEFETLERSTNLAVINGANRANRAHFLGMLKLAIPQLSNCSELDQTVVEVPDSQWETAEDQSYREYVNGLYPNQDGNAIQNQYYDNSVYVGINKKFGSIPPGYFNLPVYYKSRVVIFPETSWLNNELSITEKSLKCFYAGSLPLPIGGANINQLYNRLGFYTAWNLLPDQLKVYDSVTDHVERSRLCVDAIKWLYDNPSAVMTDHYDRYTQQNKINFLTCRSDEIAVKEFDKLVRKYL